MPPHVPGLATPSVLSFAENKFSCQCARLWRHLYYQEKWQCNFVLSKLPFERVKCLLTLELQDGQKWHPRRLNVSVPVFRHLPYLVRTLTSIV